MDFSVDTLHTKENEMKNEFKKIFKTVNVTSSAALSQTVLTKLNEAQQSSTGNICKKFSDACRGKHEHVQECGSNFGPVKIRDN